MDAPAVDPGHLLPAADWAAVAAMAAAEAERIAAGLAPPELPEVRGFATGALPLSGVVSAPSNGGRRGGAPTFGVLHSAETPLRAGYAAAIARYFAGGPGTSCHYMTDPAETWGVLDDALVAWHCGNGNPNSVALEQAGRARFSRAEWLTDDGWAQMRRNAAVMRACRDRYGIGLHWMSDAELLAAHRRQIVGGWATHDQCRRVLGGTVHTDPEPNFPLAEQMELANGDDGEDDVMNSAQQALLERTFNAVSLLRQALDRVPAQVWDTPLKEDLTVPMGAGKVLVQARQIARRGELATLALTGDVQELAGDLAEALADEGADVTPEQLDAALRRVMGTLDGGTPAAASARRS